MPNLGSALSIATLGEGGSDLYRLFANGEDGFLFGNFGDLTRLFQTSVGGSQVAADADPVGLALDDRKWAKRTFSQQMLQATEMVVDGGFDVGGTAGWTGVQCTISNLGNRIRLQSTTGFIGANARVAYYSPPGGFVAGRTYVFTATSQALGGAGTALLTLEARTPAFAAIAQTASQTGAAARSFQLIFVATASDNIIRLRWDGDSSTDLTSYVDFDNVSCKLIDGNHALQSTTGARPLYKPNGGKPYLVFDGSDDHVLTPWKPSAATTLAIAGRSVYASGFLMGGGSSGTSKRCFIGLDASGKAGFGWGTDNYVAGSGYGSDVRDQDHVFILTGDGAARELWLDGVQLVSAPPNGGPDGSGGGVALGAYNNNGTILPGTARAYGALALNRRVTPSEIALITSKFRSTYQ